MEYSVIGDFVKPNRYAVNSSINELLFKQSFTICRDFVSVKEVRKRFLLVGSYKEVWFVSNIQNN